MSSGFDEFDDDSRDWLPRRYDWPLIPAGSGGEGHDPAGRRLMQSWADELARHNELVVSEERYRLLADNTSDMICVAAPDWRLLFVSPAATQLVGVESAAMVSTSLLDYLPAADRLAVETGLSEAISRRTPEFTATHELIRADGSTLWVESAFRAVRSATGSLLTLQSATRDISARIEAERQVAASEAVLAATLEHSPIATGISDLDSRWVQVNPALCQLLGYRAEELLGRPTIDVLHPEDRVFSARQRSALLSGETDLVTSTLRYLRADGSMLLGERTASLLRGPDERFSRFVMQIQRVSLSDDRDEDTFADDPVTGLPPKHVLAHRAIDVIAAGPAAQVGLIVAGPDQFTAVNAAHGRPAGDHALAEIGRRIVAAVGDRGLVARFDGDQFGVLCPNVSDLDEVGSIACAIVGRLGAPIVLNGREVGISVSVGLAVHAGRDAAHLLREAETALAAAKRLGGARTHIIAGAVQVHDCPGVDTLAGELRTAIAQNELRLHYQPLVRFGDGGLDGHEVLVRWAHPRQGLLVPDQFLPYVENHALIVELGEWVLREACQQAAGADDRLHLGVNIASSHLARPNFAHRVATILQQTGFDPSRLIIEITETSILQANTTVINTCRALTRMGIGLALDDFGTGQSSLSSLQVLPLRVLKIDRSFTAGIGADIAAERLVIGTLQLARAIGLRTVVEGVETAAQADFLRMHGADVGQGYLYGRALPRPGPAGT